MNPPTSDDVITEVKGKSQDPPPVSSKPQIHKLAGGGTDEPNSAPAPPPSNGCEAEEQRERVGSNTSQIRNELMSHEGSITNALKEQAGANRFGRYGLGS